MRNIKKFAKDFNLEYIEDNGYVYVEFNEVTFTIRRKESTSGTSWSGQRFGSPKGYSVSNSAQRYSTETITQKDIIAEFIQTLEVTNNVTDDEKKELNQYLYNLQFKKKIKGEIKMKKPTPHGLKIDGRKNLATNLEDNSIEKTKSENSGFVKTKKSSIKKLERKIEETTDRAEIEKMKLEIEKKEKQIENYLKN